MKTVLFLFLSIIFSISAFAQKDASILMKDLAGDGVVVIAFNPVGDDAAQELKDAIDSGFIVLSFSPSQDSDIKMKNPVEVKTKIENANTDKADFENMAGIIELKCIYAEGDLKVQFTGNLSLITLKGMGNLVMIK